RHVLHLRQLTKRMQQDMGIALSCRHVPAIDSIKFGETNGRLHFSHSIIPAHAVVYVGELLFQSQQVESLLHVVTMIAEASGLPSEVFIVGSNHASLATGGECLILAKTGRRHVRERACLLALVGTAKCLS